MLQWRELVPKYCIRNGEVRTCLSPRGIASWCLENLALVGGHSSDTLIIKQERIVRLNGHKLAPYIHGHETTEPQQEQENHINWVPRVQQVCAELVATVAAGTTPAGKGSRNGRSKDAKWCKRSGWYRSASSAERHRWCRRYIPVSG